VAAGAPPPRGTGLLGLLRPSQHLAGRAGPRGRDAVARRGGSQQAKTRSTWTTTGYAAGQAGTGASPWSGAHAFLVATRTKAATSGGAKGDAAA
jgi:hypothetical protein